jgi:hypothetical protein
LYGFAGSFDLATTGWNIFYVIFAIFPILTLLRLGWFFWYSRRPELIQKRNLALIIGFGAICPSPYLWALLTCSGKMLIFFFSYIDIRYLWLFPAMMLANVLIRYQLYGLQNVRLMLVPVITAAFASSFASAIWWLKMPRTVNEYIVSPFTDFFVFFIGVSVLWITQTSWRGYFGRKLYTERNTFQDVTSYVTHLLTAPHKVKIQSTPSRRRFMISMISPPLRSGGGLKRHRMHKAPEQAINVSIRSGEWACHQCHFRRSSTPQTACSR